MLFVTRTVRRFKDNKLLMLLAILGTAIFFWNYSYLPGEPAASSVQLALHAREVSVALSNNSYVKTTEGHGPLEKEVTDKPAEAANQPGDSVQSKADAGAAQVLSPNQYPDNKQPQVPEVKLPESNEEVKRFSTGIPCPVKVTCNADSFGYYVQSGSGINTPPVICYNNELILGKAGEKDLKNYGRGVNLVVIHPKLKTVMDVKTFDLYESIDNCRELVLYLSINLEFKTQILMASMDDMIFSICASLKTLLTQFGSNKIAEMKFRDYYVLVGEKSLPGGLGIEARVPSVNDGKSFGPHPANVSGCATQPISLKIVDVSKDLGYTLENCGVKNCGYDEIEIHVSTHTIAEKKPRLCIGSKYIFHPGLAGGRGFNVVELDPLSKSVVRQGEFDTYQVESSRLEVFLEAVNPKNFVIVVVSDDGHTSLKPYARQLLKSFGYNGDAISLRTALYFVGKKGLKRTAVQSTRNADNPLKEWPPVINDRFCLPTELQEATLSQLSNKARVEFCSRHDSFADFCFVHHKNEPLVPAEANPKYEAIKEVYDIPILVLGGVNNIALSHTLRELLQQPGLNNKQVFVAYSTMFGEDYKPFIKLFEFNLIEIQPISKYVEFLTLAFEEFWKNNPNAQYAIVIDDEIVPKTGFLWYLGHALQAMKKDSNIGAASAWNPQGFINVANNASAIHVVSDFPGQAFMISKAFYDSEIRGKERTCCIQRSIQQWFQAGLSKPYKFLVPEISRADYFSSTAYSAQAHALSNLAMSMPRANTNSNFTDVPLDMNFVVNYDEKVSSDLQSAYYMTDRDISVCQSLPEAGAGRLIYPFLPKQKPNAVVVYNQASPNDYSTLKTLYPCFGLMYMDGYQPFGNYEGVTLMSLSEKRIYLVGTQSKFYKSIIQSIQPSPFVAKF